MFLSLKKNLSQYKLVCRPFKIELGEDHQSLVYAFFSRAEDTTGSEDLENTDIKPLFFHMLRVPCTVYYLPWCGD